jgi:hypothetical protein
VRVIAVVHDVPEFVEYAILEPVDDKMTATTFTPLMVLTPYTKCDAACEDGTYVCTDVHVLGIDVDKSAEKTAALELPIKPIPFEPMVMQMA